MASAITASASSSAAAIHPPSSPFALLLRRSRFASYDPAIRQTYSATSASAHRGQWGLKRPITFRRRNAFISLSKFETRAQHSEWNNAESQVRFIRRFEEMGTLPTPVVGTPWYRTLGKAKTQWLIDSDFCPGEGDGVEDSASASTSASTSTDTSSGAIQIEELGKRGPGAYGAKRAQTGQESHISPNIEAMSPKEFVRYLRKLRELRPAFLEYIKRNTGGDGQPLPIYALAQNMDADHHRRFITEHATMGFNSMDSTKIEQQPHRNGGLMYSHPSPLQTYFTTKPKPGLLLHRTTETRAGRFHMTKKEEGYVASFGGLTTFLKRRRAGGKVPLLDLTSEEGVDKARLEDSIAHMKLLPRVRLERPPRVVGMGAQGLKAVRIKTEVTTEEGEPEFGKSNPYFPGSREYVAMDGMPDRLELASFDQYSGRPSSPVLSLLFDKKAKARDQTQDQGKVDNSQVMGLLKGIVDGQPQHPWFIEGELEDESL